MQAGYKPVLAGGCLRDSLNDKPISNWDIIISLNDSNMSVPQALGFLGRYSDDYEGMPANQHLLGVYKIERPVPIDVIRVDIPPEHYIHETFDIGLCEIWWCPETGLHTTKAFEKEANGGMGICKVQRTQGNQISCI